MKFSALRATLYHELSEDRAYFVLNKYLTSGGSNLEGAKRNRGDKGWVQGDKRLEAGTWKQ